MDKKNTQMELHEDIYFHIEKNTILRIGLLIGGIVMFVWSGWSFLSMPQILEHKFSCFLNGQSYMFLPIMLTVAALIASFLMVIVAILDGF